VALVVAAVVGLPLTLPLLDVLRHPDAWRAWAEAGRLLLLARNTLLLIAGTLALTLSAGVPAAVLLYRTDLPLRRLFHFLVILSLFVPLPLAASAWQATFGSGGLLPAELWSTPSQPDPDAPAPVIAWKPWAQGMYAAVWVHAAVGLPWVILLVGFGLRWVERELEEDALTCAGPLRVIWSVTLRRSRAAVGVAALWVALQVATEMSVTDMLQVRTFAEEVYTQFVVPPPEAATDTAAAVRARAVAVSLPSVVIAALCVVAAVRVWERGVPPLDRVSEPLSFRLGWCRWPFAALLAGLVVLLAGVPLASLMWKAGLAGSPRAWSLHHVADSLSKAVRVRGVMVVESVALSALAGVLTAGLGLLTCWVLAGAGRWFRGGVIALLATAWALPGPVIGVGLNTAILLVVTMFDWSVLDTLLYSGPSAVPLVWAYVVRFFPCAVALLWPVVRLIPTELRDAARVDGAGPLQELAHVVWPLVARPFSRAALAVGVLSLGELGASKLVETPGSQTFTHEVFNLMHYGVSADVAALCLLLLAVVALGGTAVAWFNRP
jgi:iron(III) transport system permease protein